MIRPARLMFPVVALTLAACAAEAPSKTEVTSRPLTSTVASSAVTPHPSASANSGASVAASGSVTPNAGGGTGAPNASAPAPSAAKGDGETAAPANPSEGLRIYAKSRFVWIREQPGGESWTGFLWMGGSVKVLDPTPKAGAGCLTWYAIQPRGFVCVDGVNATLDPQDPALQQMRPFSPRLDSPWPHDYGESRGVPRYEDLPSPEQQRQREWDLEAHLAQIAKANTTKELPSALQGVDLSPAGTPGITFHGLPPTVHEPRKELRPLSTVAWAGQVDHQGRSFLLSGDLMWVPKDRVSVYPKVTFKGVMLGRDARLPVAFFRGKDRPQYQRLPSGEFLSIAGKTFPRLSWVELTGTEIAVGDDVFLETRVPGLFTRKSDAVVPRPQEKTPWGAAVGQPDQSPAAPKGRRTWMEVSVLQGWLIAFEDTTPVYATLIAPGRGGVPVPNKDPIETASTPTGYFKITGKFATATMVAPHEFIHSDVPWTQNFSGPHAIHGAYWHDDWGNKKSAGCINISPIDGRWLFHWTEPAIPDGWHGMRWEPKRDPASTLIVHN